MAEPEKIEIPERTGHTELARLVFYAFLLTFMLDRIVVFLIMSRRIPDLYLYVGGMATTADAHVSQIGINRHRYPTGESEETG